MNKVRTKLKSTWLILFSDNTIFIKSFKKTLNSNIEQNQKLKAKDTGTQKTKPQEEKLVLPKE